MMICCQNVEGMVFTTTTTTALLAHLLLIRLLPLPTDLLAVVVVGGCR